MSLTLKKFRVELAEGKRAAATRDNDNLDVEREVVDGHIFPARNVSEVWLNVFEKLDSKTKLAFSGACADWHDWVASSRSQYLFPEMVLNLMTNLPKSSLLQSRALCQFWTQELDTHFQSHSPYLPFEQPTTLCKHSNVFSTAEQIKSFLEEMNSHPGNPFPSRNILLDPQNPPDRVYTEFWNLVNHLLERFGTHVHRADLVIWCRRNTPIPSRLEVLSAVGNGLNHLPHLRWLYIEGQTYLPETQIREHFEANPLVRLETLEKLELSQLDSTLLNIVLNSFVSASKLKGLFVESSQLGNVLLPQTISHLRNLETLQFKGDTLSVKDFERYCRHPAVLPPLKKLELAFFTFEIPNFQLLFNTLEVFADTLDTFKVMSWGTPEDFRADFRINLPNLTKLSFFHYGGSLQPLRQLRALTHLTIINPRGFELQGEMYNSNIWKLLPSLETLIIRDKKFERVVYEQQRRAVSGNQNEFIYEH